MFELTRIAAKMVHINIRTEIHGDETETGVDLKFVIKTSNKLLGLLNEDLLGAFYCNHKAKQEELPLEDDRLPNLKFPELCASAFSYDYKGAGYRVIMHVGIDENTDIYMKPCKIGKIKIAMLEGGTVELSVTVQLNPSADELAEIANHLAGSMEITLEPPEATTLEDL